MRKSEIFRRYQPAGVMLRIFYACMLLVFFTIRSAHAVETPPSSSVGSEAEAFRKQGKLKPPSARVEVQVSEPAPPPVLAPLEPEVHFTVKKFTVVGNTVLSEKRVQAVLAPYRNKEYTVASLREVTEKLTELFRGAGYATTRVIVPQQSLTGEELMLQVLEGKVGNIGFEGNRYFSSELLNSQVDLRPGEVLNILGLERDLTRLNGNPDRKVDVALKASKIPSSSDLDFSVKDNLPLHAGYEFSNLGTLFSGLLRQGVYYADTNVLGHDDQISGRVDISERGDFVGETADYLFPLNGKGRMLTLDFANVDIHLGKDFKAFDVFGRALVFSGGFIEPLFYTKHFEGEFVGGLDMKRIRTRQQGQITSTEELRVFRFGPNIIQRDLTGRSIWTNQFDVAFSGFLGGSKRNDSRSDRPRTGGQFFSYQLGWARLQNLWFKLQGILRAQAQLTAWRLVSAQQMRLGGADTVRGYPEGDYLADYGINFSQELRVPLYPIPEDWKIPFTNKTWRETVQAALFADEARGWLNNAPIEENKNKTLVGLGGGVRVYLGNQIAFRGDWASPIGDPPSQGGRSVRFHFALKVGF